MLPDKPNAVRSYLAKPRPFLGTISGCSLAFIAFLIGTAALVFARVDFSPALFALSRLLFKLSYPDGGEPSWPWNMALWYGGAVVQWTAIGLFVDLVRWRLRAARERRRHASF
jgi:hypothetical protein